MVVVVEVKLSAAAIVTCGTLVVVVGTLVVVVGTLVVVVDITLFGSFIFCCDDFCSVSEEQEHKKHTCGVQRYAIIIVRKR